MFDRVDPDSPRRARVGVGPSLAMWVALACLATHLSAVFHLVLVRHAHCAEHGELVHVAEESAHHARHRDDAEPRRTAESRATRGAPETTGHAHDHCDAVAERRKGFLSAAFIQSPVALSGLAPALPRTTEAPTPRRLRYAFAPKTSPPA